MLRNCIAILAALGALAIAIPASAGNLFVTAGAGIDAGDIENPAAWSDTVSGSVQIGWDFGTPALALEYNAARAGADTAFIVGQLDFGKGRFRPGVGAGVGISMDGFGFEDDHHAQLSAGAQYYLTDSLALEGRYRWISDIDDIGDGNGDILARIRFDF